MLDPDASIAFKSKGKMLHDAWFGFIKANIAKHELNYPMRVVGKLRFNVINHYKLSQPGINLPTL